MQIVIPVFKEETEKRGAVQVSWVLVSEVI